MSLTALGGPKNDSLDSSVPQSHVEGKGIEMPFSFRSQDKDCSHGSVSFGRSSGCLKNRSQKTLLSVR